MSYFPLKSSYSFTFLGRVELRFQAGSLVKVLFSVEIKLFFRP